MGRRRRKVIRIPKKRLPKIWGCPKCGMTKSIRIIISETKTTAKVTCGKCGEFVTKNLTGNPTSFVCPHCNHEIVTISLISSDAVKIKCGSCGTINFHQITEQETLFNCSCDLPRGRFLIRPAERLATVHCGKCGLKEYLEMRPNDQPIDIYGRFYDGYFGIHRPPPPPKKESYLDILKREIKIEVLIPHDAEGVSVISDEEKKIFRRLAEEEKKERKLRRQD